MGIVTPGFRGRRRRSHVKLPPGQYLTSDFPVLSAGPTPPVESDDSNSALRSPALRVVAYLPHMAPTLTRRRRSGCPANREQARRPVPPAHGVGRM